MVQETDSLGCNVMWVTAKPPKAKREQRCSSWRERWKQANSYGKELSIRGSSDCRQDMVRGQSCNDGRGAGLGLGSGFYTAIFGVLSFRQ